VHFDVHFDQRGDRAWYCDRARLTPVPLRENRPVVLRRSMPLGQVQHTHSLAAPYRALASQWLKFAVPRWLVNLNVQQTEDWS